MTNAALQSETAIERPLSVRQRVYDAIGWPVWVFDSFFLAQAVVVIAIIALQLSGISFEAVNESIFNTVLAALIYLIAVAIVVYVPVPRKKGRVTMQTIGLGRLPSWKDFAFAPAAFIIYMVLTGILLNAVTHVIPGFNSDQAQDVGFQDISKYYEYVLAFVTLVVIAPIAEEVLMRGYLYGKLRDVMPKYGAMLITAVTFGILHMQWNVGLDVFVLSLVMTSLRETTGSIWAGILLHMLKNGIAFYFLFINPDFLHTIGG